MSADFGKICNLSRTLLSFFLKIYYRIQLIPMAITMHVIG